MVTESFKTGRLVITSSIDHWINQVGEKGLEFTKKCLKRYLSRDWGEMDEMDKELNNAAFESGNIRILASYDLPENLRSFSPDNRIWIITECDHSVTTILFPSDY